MTTSNKPYSNVDSVANISSLASILSISKEELLTISNSVNELWKPGKLLFKKNGEPRPTLDAKKPLKTIHHRIKERLLKKVTYPDYLLGGISSDDFFKRDFRQHALVHSGKKYLIEEDVKDFFPNTSFDVVKSIWQYFFNFTPEVSEILTKLTTLNGSLPQGWKTSSYLANLAFWDKEHLLVSEFQKRGIAYSRFMDDICASSRHQLEEKDKTYIVSSIYKMLFSLGYSPKRTKHKISSSAERMKVTGLNINTNRPTLPKKEKSNIKTAVYECERLAKKDKTSELYKKKWRSCSGRVARLKQFHPNRGKKLRSRLNLIKPI